MNQDPSPLHHRARIVEQPFASPLPVIGRLVAGVRTAWNNVAARWYVQALFRQQVDFNLLTADELQDLGARLAEQDADQTALARQVAELRAVVSRLQQRVQELEARQR